ncbi:MAG: cobyrinate a,c-diamide synthase, partial [Mogibacterium sp.]|nr:cobyrinate a,c-diamide synthase [Mogibacterium sp.]
CGPDYIDPMFHRTVLGVPSENLDPYFEGADGLRGILARSGGLQVLEGVMGIYDGRRTGSSCYDVARATGTPVLLLYDAKGTGETMLSLLRGILLDDTDHLIRGIVINRISESFYRQMKPLLGEMLTELGGYTKLIGFLPRTQGIHLESRHLGLRMPEEIQDLRNQVTEAASLIREHCDLERIRSIMTQASDLSETAAECGTPVTSGTGLTLAVARDEAFCFYYEQNLRMFRERGVTIWEFSPVRDRVLPEDADGILLGGGYPELYAKELSENTSMTGSIRQAILSGTPSLAECGGFLYLLEELEAPDGSSYPMTGVFSGKGWNTGKLGRFGYVGISREQDRYQTLLPHDSVIRGHEFHYYDTDNNGEACLAVRPGRDERWRCMHAGPEHLWGFPHLWYGSCPEFVEQFIRSMRNHSRREAR